MQCQLPQEPEIIHLIGFYSRAPMHCAVLSAARSGPICETYAAKHIPRHVWKHSIYPEIVLIGYSWELDIEALSPYRLRRLRESRTAHGCIRELTNRALELQAQRQRQLVTRIRRNLARGHTVEQSAPLKQDALAICLRKDPAHGSFPNYPWSQYL